MAIKFLGFQEIRRVIQKHKTRARTQGLEADNDEDGDGAGKVRFEIESVSTRMFRFFVLSFLICLFSPCSGVLAVLVSILRDLICSSVGVETELKFIY